MTPRALYLGGLSALALLGLASTASAQQVKIERAVARVVVIPENRTDVGVEIVNGKAELPSLQIERRGPNLVINGQLGGVQRAFNRHSMITRCSAGDVSANQPGQGAEVEVRGHGKVALEDAPLIILRTPRDVAVAADNGVFGSIGPGARSVDLATAGCGYWTIANVEAKAKLALAGSGGMRIGSSGSLDLSIGGSGTITARQTRALAVAIGGSGDVELARLDGKADISVGGAGDVTIKSGRSEALDIAIAGSGNVRFDGQAEDVSVAIVGAGDVQLREATGRVSRSIAGSGRVRIGD